MDITSHVEKVSHFWHLTMECSGEHYTAVTPQGLQDRSTNRRLPDLHAHAPARILKEIGSVLKDWVGVDVPPPATKTVDLEGRLIQDVAEGRSVICRPRFLDLLTRSKSAGRASRTSESVDGKRKRAAQDS
jgi:hypothetical protein